MEPLKNALAHLGGTWRVATEIPLVYRSWDEFVDACMLAGTEYLASQNTWEFSGSWWEGLISKCVHAQTLRELSSKCVEI